ISCQPGMTATQVSELLREKSRSIVANGRRTTIAEWIIDGHLSLSGLTTESLSEIGLLRELRSSLHAGHSGAWPYRIRFSDNSTVDASRHPAVAAQEFAAVVRERILKIGQRNGKFEHATIGTPIGAGSEAAVGLDVLRRVA
ncbi:MAG: hypothetical protein O2856_14485, partial [Planctomycetota bacterium]|nr:hypothetical protein [Planctomycetota bacterium]